MLPPFPSSIPRRVKLCVLSRPTDVSASGVEVKDVKEQLRLTKSLVKSTQWRLVQKLRRVCSCHAESPKPRTLMEKMTAEPRPQVKQSFVELERNKPLQRFANVLAQLRELREEALQRDGREAEEDVEFEEAGHQICQQLYATCLLDLFASSFRKQSIVRLRSP